VTGGLPTALAVAGTALMAVAIFGPFRKPVEVEADDAAGDAPAIAQWPALVEATAIACDARARIDLADALGALQSPWAEAILRQAYETESDPDVRSAIASALTLSSSQSLVT
jgi:HEAT repeat protein